MVTLDVVVALSTAIGRTRKSKRDEEEREEEEERVVEEAARHKE